ncbi:MAG: 3-hydroxyacyl-CoA dehydrogenase family protein [Magnetospirillum sp.]|nr:3-hydroxyacyl-CoA dehydrogenase family protein [Magnetospirillum sp.]
MTESIRSVAVIGGGTMGSGIAAASAAAGRRVLVLEDSPEAVEKARARVLAAARDEAERDAIAGLTEFATIAGGLPRLAEYDWVCEAIIEDLAAKRRLFEAIERHRRPGSVVSTNTSGIPLAAITEGFPATLRRDIAVTHFFNPVRVMRLLELVPGADTRPEVLEALTAYGREALGKGVVRAKDTVNFIANRIGCFWMLSGLHKAEAALAEGLRQEEVDAVLSAPVGLPATGLYGLIDLIGLDVMDYVGVNLAANLPAGDPGHAYAAFPPAVRRLRERGQLGRKSGGGFTRVLKAADGSKVKEVFDLVADAWRPAVAVTIAETDPLFADSAAGRLAWDVMGDTLFYAADLLPEIADDIVAVDRALRWGFNWQRGPFEFLDHLGPQRVIKRLHAEGRRLPRLLALLEQGGHASFYRDGQFLGLDGRYHPVPAE